MKAPRSHCDYPFSSPSSIPEIGHALSGQVLLHCPMLVPMAPALKHECKTHFPMTALAKVRTLSVTFGEPIAPAEVSSFRGAIIEKVGIGASDWYHNHNNTPGRAHDFHYRYPLVQYHLDRGRPRIVFINEAVEDARHFFTQPDWSLHLAGRPYQPTIEGIKAAQSDFGLLEQPRAYRISRWLALTEQNYAEYTATPRLADKLTLLERILAGNVLRMANAFGYHFSRRFELCLTDLGQVRAIPYKGVMLLAFDVGFCVDVALPLGLSLGKGCSLGFGRLALPRKDENEPIMNTPSIF